MGQCKIQVEQRDGSWADVRFFQSTSGQIVSQKLREVKAIYKHQRVRAVDPNGLLIDLAP